MGVASIVEPGEVEEAFKEYVEYGLLNEDWARWSELFTDDAVYVDHYWGIFRGPAEIRIWNEIVCSACPQNYDFPICYAIDGPRLILKGQITADNPEPGGAPFAQPIIQYLEYGGDGKWSREEDFWNLSQARLLSKQYEEAREKFDPGHPLKMTRRHWQDTPIEWARPEPAFQVRPSWVGKDEVAPINNRRDLKMGERLPY